MDEIAFTDFYFEQLVRSRLKKQEGPILASEAATITIFSVENTKSGSIEDLRHLPSLEILSVRTGASDISHLRGLKRLKKLTLSFNRLEDVTPLSELPSLEILDLRGNKLVDLSPLHGLSALKQLFLSQNGIMDVSPLSGLASLTRLALDQNRITDVSGLTTLPSLTCLILTSNAISDITPLAKLVTLEELHIGNNTIKSLEPLASLVRLVRLFAPHNCLSDVKPLSRLVALQRLDLDGNEITDLSPVLGLGNLVNLTVKDNPVKDGAPASKTSRAGKENIEKHASGQGGAKLPYTCKCGYVVTDPPLLEEHAYLDRCSEYLLRNRDAVQSVFAPLEGKAELNRFFKAFMAHYSHQLNEGAQCEITKLLDFFPGRDIRLSEEEIGDMLHGIQARFLCNQRNIVILNKLLDLLEQMKEEQGGERANFITDKTKGAMEKIAADLEKQLTSGRENRFFYPSNPNESAVRIRVLLNQHDPMARMRSLLPQDHWFGRGTLLYKHDNGYPVYDSDPYKDLYGSIVYNNKLCKNRQNLQGIPRDTHGDILTFDRRRRAERMMARLMLHNWDEANGEDRTLWMQPIEAELTESEYEHVFFNVVKRNDYGYLSLCIMNLSSFLKTHVPGNVLKQLLAAFVNTPIKDHNDMVRRGEAVDKLKIIMNEDIDDFVVELEESDNFGAFVNEYIGKLTLNERVICKRLLQHASTASGDKPDTAFTEKAKQLLASTVVPRMRTFAESWIDCLIHMPALKIPGKRNYPAQHNFLAHNNLVIVKGIIWICPLFDSPGLMGKLVNLCCRTSTEKLCGAPLSTAVSYACLHAVAMSKNARDGFSLLKSKILDKAILAKIDEYIVSPS